MLECSSNCLTLSLTVKLFTIITVLALQTKVPVMLIVLGVQHNVITKYCGKPAN